MTGRNIITDAFAELNIIGAGETLSPEDADLGLGKLNRLFDNWNADHKASYCDVFTTFTTTPSVTPQTIGPGGHFVVTQRPVTIEGASLVVGTVKTPINLRDQEWYRGLVVPSITGAYPTDCFYEPDWPLGKLYFYPVVSAARSIELQIRALLAAFTLDTVFSLPPGYQDAITLSLAESLTSAYPGAVASGDLKRNASDARARIFGNNTPIPRLRTRDSGMPGGGGGSYDYRSGQFRK